MCLRAAPRSHSITCVKHFLLVAIGGAIGSVVRWKLGGAILHQTSDWRFPLGTFIVNVLGCLIVGALAALVAKHDWFSPDARLFLFTGLAGGFTTFSDIFGHEEMRATNGRR